MSCLKKHKQFRKPIQIVVDILRSTQTSTRQYKIIREANLNRRMWKRHIPFLVQHGYLTKLVEGYFATERGNEVIHAYNCLTKLKLELEDHHKVLGGKIDS